MELLISTGPDRAQVVPLAEGKSFVIGRGEDADVRLNDPHASRKHCRIKVEKGVVNVEDAGSRAGTFVNGEQITARPLFPGDVVKVGDTEVRLVVDSPLRGASTIQRPAPAASLTSPRQVDDLSSLVGTTLHKYVIDRPIAVGRTGTIFLARRAQGSEKLALKVIAPSIARHEKEMQRFLRAMKTMLPIQHPHLIRLHNAGKSSGHYWLAMEYVEGESIAQIIQKSGFAGMLDWQYAYRVAVHVARALEAAAGHQIVHRNITPGNILIRSSDKQAKLGDLMIAKAFDGVLRNDITEKGELVGELAYLSPEATHGTDHLDARSDIYSLGAAVYVLLTGRPPFEAKSYGEMITKIRKDPPLSPKTYQLSVNDLFSGVILRMLEKNPDERYQSPAQLLKDLERVGKFAGIQV